MSAASASAPPLAGIEQNALFAQRIADPAQCPICMRAALSDAHCQNCGANLGGETGAQLWRASQDAAAALQRRDGLLRAVLLENEGAKASPSAPSSAPLQQLFAVAGAGLVAIAAIVFTFFNPDLENRVLRSAIVGTVTFALLGTAWLLSTRSSRSSAEIVGGLSAVFVGIDIWALSQAASDSTGAWLIAAAATLVGAIAALYFSAKAGLRSWSFAAMLGFALVPVLLAGAANAWSTLGSPRVPLATAIGALGLVLVVTAQFAWLPRLAGSFAESGGASEARGAGAASETGGANESLGTRADDSLRGNDAAVLTGTLGMPAAGRAEHRLLGVLQIVTALSAIPTLAVGMVTGELVGVALLLAGFGLSAVLAARFFARGFWSLVAGACGAAALPALAFSGYSLGAWQLTVVTVSAAVGAVLVCAFATRPSSTLRAPVSYAAVLVPAVFSLPTLLTGFAMLSAPNEQGGFVFRGDSAMWTVVVGAASLSAGAIAVAGICERGVRLAGPGQGLAAEAAPGRAVRGAALPSLWFLRGLCLVMAMVFALLAMMLAIKLLLGGIWPDAIAAEAYLLPTACAAMLVAIWCSARGSRQLTLYAVGLGLAIVPTLMLLVEGEKGESGSVTRAIGLLAASAALTALGLIMRRSGSRTPAGTTTLNGSVAASPRAELGTISFIAAMVAALAGWAYAAALGQNGSSFVGCLAVSAVGAALMLAAEHALRSSIAKISASQWLGAPAAFVLAAGCWPAIDRNWGDIWSMWGLMFAYLVLMVVTAHRQLRGRGPRVPVLALFAIALITAIVAWSPRELRVDVFSLPLGLMLTLAGAIALRQAIRAGAADGTAGGAAGATVDAVTGRAASSSASRMRGSRSPGDWSSGERATGVPAPHSGFSITRWPLDHRGSWALLGPGISVTVLASIIATFTDPQTWRAVLVMVIALLAMLIGAKLRLAAPFVLGLIVLPIENVFVFAVQIGRGIDSMPWWITLATIGAVLLSVAVVSERRADGRQGLIARMRDLA